MGEQPLVLVVDDERNFCRILEAKLRLSGFEVAVAPSLRDAKEILRTRPVRLVLLDVRLPDGNGLQALPTLRAMSPVATFMLITAYEEEDLRGRAAEAGAAEVLYKPFDLDYLIDIVRGMLPERILDPSLVDSPLACVVAMGQRATCKVKYNSETETLEGRVTDLRADTFDVSGDGLRDRAVPAAMTVSLAGEDGLYEFGARVIAAESSAGTVSLRKPAVIYRRQRRRYVRAPFDRHVILVLDPDAGASAYLLDALAVDISLCGIGLFADRSVAPGEAVQIDWPYPGHDARPPDTGALGQVARCQPSTGVETRPGYRIGVKFLRMSRRRKRWLVDHLGVHSTV